MNGEHTEFEALILRLPDSDLTPEEKRALQEHLNGCADCRRLFRALRDVTEELDAQAEPPASLADGVMARIHAAEAGNDSPSKDAPERRDLDRRAHNRKMRRRRGLGAIVSVAAVLVLAVGGGLFAARSLFRAGGSAAPMAQSVSLEAAIAEEATAAAPAAGADGLLYAAAAAEEAPMEEAFEAEAAAQNDADSGMVDSVYPVYPLESPAHVTEGCEADFEDLLRDIGWPDGVPETSFRAIAYVEYRGVIYEFLSDPDEQYLLWRDAAEGYDIIHSPASVDTLFFLIG